MTDNKRMSLSDIWLCSLLAASLITTGTFAVKELASYTSNAADAHRKKVLSDFMAQDIGHVKADEVRVLSYGINIPSLGLFETAIAIRDKSNPGQSFHGAWFVPTH